MIFALATPPLLIPIAEVGAEVRAEVGAEVRAEIGAEVVIVRAERVENRSPDGQRLSGDDLVNLAGVRLDEALRVVPGLGLFRRTSSGAANATIQGLSLRPIAPNGAGRALVSLDGVPQNDPFGGWIYWSRYDPVFVDYVDIKRGSAGAGFGPMALTGTLDITEARGRPAHFTASFGSANARHISGRQSFFTPGAVFTAMGAWQASDGDIPVSKGQRGAADVPANFEALSLTLVTDLAADSGAWSFRTSGFSEAKGAGLIGGQSAAYGLDASVARRFEGEWGQSRVLLYAQGREFSNQTVAVTALRRGTVAALDQYGTPSSAWGGSFALVPNPNRNMAKVSLDWRRAQGETREFFRNIGNSFTRTRVAGGSQDLAGIGVFLGQPINVDALDVRLDGGFRVDYWRNHGGLRRESDRATGVSTLNEVAADKDSTIVTGRFSVSQARGPLAISLYRTFRPPTLNELHRPFRVGNDVTEANSALMPETLIGLDLDLQTTRAWGGGTLSTAATLYVNQLRDPIANVTLGGGPGVFPRVGFLPAGGSLRERGNVGQIDATGLEARMTWDAGPSGITWMIAGSFTQARVNGGDSLPQLTGKRPAQAPRWSAVASLSMPLTQDLTIALTARGEGMRFEDDLNTRKLPAYGAVDMRVGWQLNESTQIYLSGENILGSPIVTLVAGDGVISLAQKQLFRIGIRVGGPTIKQ